MFNSYFDKIFIINLAERTDRFQFCEEQFRKHNITNYERFDAFKLKENDSPLLIGELGCLLSHKEIINIAQKNKYKRILILEDDCEFHPDLNSLFQNYIIQVPSKYDMLYLGGNHVGGVQMISNNVGKITHTFALHCYALQEHIYPVLLNKLEKYDRQVDVVFTDVQKNNNSFVFRPHLAWQKEGFSDIQGGIVNYDFLR